MTSVNRNPTFNYSQPDSYRFSHDSVFLAREVFERHEHQLNRPGFRALDLCAGCGIVGLDVVYHQFRTGKPFLGQLDFVEVQSDYRHHFAENVLRLRAAFPQKNLNVNWTEVNYQNFKAEEGYDLIFANPPYFILGEGQLSPDPFKNRCRFFIDADWNSLIEVIARSLKPGGTGYFLVRDELRQKVQRFGHRRIVFDFKIRGTWVARLSDDTP